MSTEPPSAPKKSKRSTGMQFLLRGLAISLPPVLTVVILIWVGQGINEYIISPVSTIVRMLIALPIRDALPTNQLVAWDKLPPLKYYPQTDYRITQALRDRLQYRLDEKPEPSTARISPDGLESQGNEVYIPFGDESVPYSDFRAVAAKLRPNEMPTSVTGLYMELVTIRYFPRLFQLSAVAVILTVILLYFLGRLVTARIGSWAVARMETQVLTRLPVISHVYSSVKQVTDFLFSERTVEYNRVVAVEYPRRGLWSLGFVTSDSMLEITVAAGEPLVTVLMPTSPMPMTGFAVSVPRSGVLDLNITIDQAFQYCLSCGVLVPEHQKVTPELLQQELARRLTAGIEQSGSGRSVTKVVPSSEEPTESAMNSENNPQTDEPPTEAPP